MKPHLQHCNTLRSLFIMPAAFLFCFTAALTGCSQPQVYLPEGTYYIDSMTGSDDAEGLSPDTAWQSIARLNYTTVAPGSRVLFKSGAVFRGSLRPSSGEAGKPVIYGIYEGDEKAVIQNSVDLSSASDWIDKGGGLWKADASFSFDVGNIIFNGSGCAVRKWSKSEVVSDGDYYFDRFWKSLWFKSGENPGSRYASVEAALTDHVINQSNVTYAEFENLHIRYGGAHGFGGGETEGLHIHDCEFSYIGGGFLYEKDGKPVRYGNGIEFWGNASGNTVESCYFHDIYDTGVTNQNHSSSSVQENIIYRNNIIENCALACFEFWNRPESSSMSNILFENNTCINPGEGWGTQRPDLHGSHVSVFGNQAVVEGVTIRNNIFYGGNMVFFFDERTFASADVASYNNCLYPVEDGAYDYLCVVWDDVSIDSSVKYGAGQLTELQSDSGREAGSITADPQFEGDDYPWRLSATSPCPDWGSSGF